MLTLDELSRHFQRHDPFSRQLDIRLLSIEDGHSVAEMPLDVRHSNGMGNAHGAAIFALIDFVFAAASNAAGIYRVTAQSSVSFLRPGRKGPLRGEARRIRSGRHLGTYDVKVTDAEGALIAVAILTSSDTGKTLPL